MRRFVYLIGLIAIAVGGDALGDKLEPSIAALSANEHAVAKLILTVVAWVFHFAGMFCTVMLFIVGAGFPLLYGFYRLVDDRLIPGPMDDWLAELYAPLKSKISKETWLRTMKWSGVICLIAGGCLLGSNTYLSPYGFVLLATSSGQWLVASIIEKNKEQIVLYAVMFIMVDCFGVYRWLMI
jgi:hypothetical protein